MLSLFAALTLALSVAQASPVPKEVEARIFGAIEPVAPIISGSGSGFITGAGAGAVDVLKVVQVAASGSGTIAGSGSGVVSLPIVNGLGGTGLALGSNGGYHWTCPPHWIRPTWYQFGYYDARGIWVTSEAAIEIYLRETLHFTHIVVDNSYDLFLDIEAAARATAIHRAHQFGHWTRGLVESVDVFIALDVDVSASILLGSFGYVREEAK